MTNQNVATNSKNDNTSAPTSRHTPMSTEELHTHLKESGFSLQDMETAIKEEKKNTKKKSTRKFEAIDFNDLVIRFDGDTLDDSWYLAMNHVNMPVKVVPGNVYLEDGSELLQTEYDTDTGRHGIYHFVMVDRQRDGVWKALSPVSEMYAAIAPEGIYRNLRETLDNVAPGGYRINYCYNSYSGGEQRLSIEVKNMVGFHKMDNTTMELILVTSLDRSRKHTLIAQPVINGKPIYFVDTGKTQFNLATRHVQSAAEKVVDFNASIGAIIENWNTSIIPYTMFMSDDGFNEKEVYALLSGIVEDSKLPDSMIERMPLIKQSTCGTVPLDGIMQICSTIEDDTNLSPMAKAKHAEKVGKAIASRVSKLFRNKSA